MNHLNFKLLIIILLIFTSEINNLINNRKNLLV